MSVSPIGPFRDSLMDQGHPGICQILRLGTSKKTSVYTACIHVCMYDIHV